MYLRYYHLREPPFGITPDPAFLYLSPSHKEALASVLYGIEKRKGFISVTGEVGCGKTTILKAVLARVDPERVKVVYLFNPDLAFPELIDAVVDELGLDIATQNITHAVRDLHRYLIDIYRQRKHVVLVIDEVQRMPLDTLERLRMLSNLETAKDKLIQIVLSGQPEFANVLLAKPALRQLRERIAIRAEIRPLTPAESVDYIAHRLGRAGYGKTRVFTPRALRWIAHRTRGNPRSINILCDNALIAGYADQELPVTAKTVRRAAAGLGWVNHRATLKLGAAAAAVAVVVACAWAALGQVRGKPSPPADEIALGAPESPTVFAAARPEDVTSEPAPPIEAAPLYDAPHAADAGPGDPASYASYAFSDVVDVFEHYWEAPPAALTDVGPLKDPSAVPPVSPKPSVEVVCGTEPALFAETLDPLPNDAATTPVSGAGAPATRKVQPGDTLGRMLIETYGRVDNTLIERVMQRNPNIRDPNKILVGDIIVFPGTADTTRHGE